MNLSLETRNPRISLCETTLETNLRMINGITRRFKPENWL